MNVMIREELSIPIFIKTFIEKQLINANFLIVVILKILGTRYNMWINLCS